MSGWTILAFAVACACAALLFLCIVADVLGAVTRDLDRREQASRKAYERRAEEQAVAATAPTRAAG